MHLKWKTFLILVKLPLKIVATCGNIWILQTVQSSFPSLSEKRNENEKQFTKTSLGKKSFPSKAFPVCRRKTADYLQN